MPTNSNSQASSPRPCCRQIVGWMGMRSPISQPYRSALARPATAPFRVSIQRSFSSSLSRTSGYMSRYSAGCTGDCMKKFDGS